jgi:hypothetical protein
VRLVWTDLEVDIVDRVLERLGTTESTTLAIKREVAGKIQVTSLLWDVILPGEVLEVRRVDGRLHVAEASAPRRRGPSGWVLMTLAPGTAAIDKVIEA